MFKYGQLGLIKLFYYFISVKIDLKYKFSTSQSFHVYCNVLGFYIVYFSPSNYLMFSIHSTETIIPMNIMSVFIVVKVNVTTVQ